MAAPPGSPSPTASSTPARWARSPWPIPTPTSSTPAWAKPACAATPPTATASTSPSMAARPGTHMGLARHPPHRRSASASQAIPTSSYVAALGHLWGPNDERGVYRSTDGGATWKQVLTRGRDAGAVDLAMDPSNPQRALRHLLAGPPQALALSIAAAPAAAFSNPPTAATPGPTSRTHRGLPRGVLGPHRRHRFARQSRARLGHRGSRRWRRVPLRQRRPHLDQGQRAEHPAPARLVLLPHFRRSAKSPTPSTSLNTGMYKLDRRRPHLHRHAHAARRQSRPLDRAQRSRSA